MSEVVGIRLHPSPASQRARMGSAPALMQYAAVRSIFLAISPLAVLNLFPFEAGWFLTLRLHSGAVRRCASSCTCT